MNVIASQSKGIAIERSDLLYSIHENNYQIASLQHTNSLTVRNDDLKKATMKKIKLITAILMIQAICLGQIINVPGDQPNIQAGIIAATDGDTVLVEDGTYFENIRFMGKAITVASRFLIDGDDDHIDNTVIDGSQATNPDSASTVMFVNFEDTTSILNGFTVQGGTGLINSTWNVRYGGGIACWESGPSILNNKIKDNTLTETTASAGGVGIGSWSETGNWWIIIDNNIISDNISATNAESAFGGGIYVMTNGFIRNNTIENNTCYNASQQADGGGIEIQQMAGLSIHVLIDNNIIQNNELEGNECFGAGIVNYSATATISNNEIKNNYCNSETFSHGGGIYTIHAGQMTITNNEVIGNTCEGTRNWGGGYFCYDPYGKLYITNNEFSNNEMTGTEYWFGAGIMINEFSNLIHVKNNRFENNGGNVVSEWSMGGALVYYTDQGYEVITENNIFSNNYAERGAGIWTFNLDNHKIQNNVFSENQADSYGGAIRFRQNLGDEEDFPFIPKYNQVFNNNSFKEDTIHPLLVNNVFIGNSAGYGGAIYSDYIQEGPIIFNSIFWENNASNSKDIYNYSSNEIIVSYSNIDTTNIFTPWTGENNINVDPLFIDDSCHLDEVSQCIEAGATSIEINGITYHCPDFDMDGQIRPLNGTADIGVDEVLITGISNPFVKQNTFSLDVYPNPLSTEANIEFTLLKAEYVSLSVFDISGKQMETIISAELQKGNHQLQWNADGLKVGIYFIRLETENSQQVCEALILK